MFESSFNISGPGLNIVMCIAPRGIPPLRLREEELFILQTCYFNDDTLGTGRDMDFKAY